MIILIVSMLIFVSGCILYRFINISIFELIDER